MEEAEKRTDMPGGSLTGPALSIVVITKDTRELLEGLLHTIAQDVSLVPIGFETIVIDNASTDGTDLLVAGSFPGVAYVRNARNMGFAFSVNEGRRHAKGRFILFLNSDARLIEGEIAKMAALAEGLPDAAIMGPQLVYEDLGDQRSVAAVPVLSDEFFLRSLRGRGHAAAGKGGTGQCVDVESLIGAAIMVRKDLFDDLGGFDERFFFFLEETDFCVRARQRGFKVVFFPGIRVVHLQGATVRRTWVDGRMEYNISLRKFFRKHYGTACTLVFDAVRFIKALVFVVFTPFSIFSAKMRMRYSYYLKLLWWYLRGCPDNAGLNKNRL